MTRIKLGEGLSKLGNARRRRVVRLTAADRLERGLLDIRRRVEIGFAQGEIKDLDTLRFQSPGLGPHRQRRRGRDQARTLASVTA